MLFSSPPLAILVGAFLGNTVEVPEDDSPWPQWRGPGQNGVSTAKGLPTEWGPEKNVAWKTALPAWSGSTPVIGGGCVFVVSPSASGVAEAPPQEEEGGRGGGRRGRGGGRRGGGRHPGGSEIQLLCLGQADGAVRWTRGLDEGNQSFRKGNSASPSPVTDGDLVWSVTGNGSVVAFDLDGSEVWRFDLQEEWGSFGHNWGYASSPLLLDDKVIVEVLHGSRTTEPSYLVALDTQTGDVVWRVERPTDASRESPDAYTTPLRFEHGDVTQVVVSGGDYVTGHDPETGTELWRVSGLNPQRRSNYRIVPSPLASAGMIYAPTRVRPLLAISFGDDGKPREEPIAWKWDERGGPDVPTPVCDGEFFYMVDDGGLLTCLDAATGERHYGPERTGASGVSASPLLADGRLFVVSEEGETVVVKAGAEFEVLATNALDGSYTLSSPVAVADRLYLRTGEHLYCIANSEE